MLQSISLSSISSTIIPRRNPGIKAWWCHQPYKNDEMILSTKFYNPQSPNPSALKLSNPGRDSFLVGPNDTIRIFVPDSFLTAGLQDESFRSFFVSHPLTKTMTTVTLATHKTLHRPRALSLIADRLPPILNLPAELILAIVELVISEHKPATLATICKGIRIVVEIVLYRIVVLDTPKTIDLFYRTILSRPRTFFAEHVKKLLVNWELPNSYMSSISKIIASCPSLRYLVSPSCSLIHAGLQVSDYDGLSELTIQSYAGGDDSGSVPHFLKLSMTLTHLRFCQPSDSWCSPSFILSTFGSLPHLSYLQLSRKADANEDNDIEFVKDIRMLLYSRPMLKTIVVSIFASCTWPASRPEDSHIWRLLCSVQEEDQRVVILNGTFDEWRDLGGYSQKALWSGWQATDFWAAATARSQRVTSLDESLST